MTKKRALFTVVVIVVVLGIVLIPKLVPSAHVENSAVSADSTNSIRFVYSTAAAEDNLANRTIFTYDDLKQIEPGDSDEKLVDARTYDPDIIAVHENEEMHQYTGDQVLVRDDVARRLAEANKELKKENMTLKVVFGYRHPEVQEKYFAEQKAALAEENPDASNEELERMTHTYVAVPDIGGHPTGGALDITIVKDGKELDMGSTIVDFDQPNKMMTFSDDITKAQLANRMILHDVLASVGFCPFYGEWWHFSYGDREWAAFYGYDKALYGPITYSSDQDR